MRKGPERLEKTATLTDTRAQCSAKTALLKSSLVLADFSSTRTAHISSHCTGNGLRFYGRSVASLGGSLSLFVAVGQITLVNALVCSKYYQLR